MRQLSDEEKSLNSKATERLKKRNVLLQRYFIPKYRAEIKYGLQNNFESIKRQYLDAINEWEVELNTNKQKIQIMTDQNEKGVEEKQQDQNIN